MEDAAYIGLNDRDLEIQISELHHLPSEQVMKWMEIPKGVFSDDEFGVRRTGGQISNRNRSKNGRMAGDTTPTDNNGSAANQVSAGIRNKT